MRIMHSGSVLIALTVLLLLPGPLRTEEIPAEDSTMTQPPKPDGETRPDATTSPTAPETEADHSSDTESPPSAAAVSEAPAETRTLSELPDPQPVTAETVALSSDTPDTQDTLDPDGTDVADRTAPNRQTGAFDNAFVLSSENGAFRFRPTGFVQPRFRMAIHPDGDEPLAGSGFTLQRARLGFSATLFEITRVCLDSDFAGGTGQLVDFYADIDPQGGVLQVRAGYFRPPFGRQLLSATTALQFIEYARAWQDPALNLMLGRDLGVALLGQWNDRLEYSVGIWNGNPGQLFVASRTTENGLETPGIPNYQVGGRVAVHLLSLLQKGDPLPLGGEPDLMFSERPRLVVGGAFLYNRRHDQDILMDEVPALYYDNRYRIGAEVAFRWKGLSVQGEFFAAITRAHSGTDTDILAELRRFDREPTGMGTYLQAGYYVVPQKVEVAARFDVVDEDIRLRGRRFYPGVGATWHIFGNHLKAQFMYRLNTQHGYQSASGSTRQADPNWIPTTHDLFVMLQASI